MTSTQRVMAAVNFQQPDRLPVWDGSYQESFSENWRRCLGLAGDLHPADHYRIDISIHVADETLFPSRQGLVRDDGDNEIRRDGWGRTVRVGKRDSYFAETLTSSLENSAALDQLAFEPAGLDSRYENFIRELAAERAAGRCPFAKIGGIYIRSHFLRGEDRLLLDMAADEGFCAALFDRMTEHLTEMALETLRRGDLWDTGLFVFDDMASNQATMFSPAMFERYFLPRYQKLISTVREAGCRHVFLHSDGNIQPVLDLLVAAGFEGFNPLEPRCGLDLVKLREKYSRRMVFFGGICNTRILPGGDKKAIAAHVRPLIELGREGGLILGQASVVDDVPPAAYDYYMSLVRQYGGYD